MITVQSKQDALAALSRSALSGVAFDSLLQLTIQLTLRVLDLSFCKIIERIPNLPEGQCLLFRAIGGQWAPELENKVFDAGEEPHAAFTLTVQEPVITQNIYTETRFKASPIHYEYGLVSGAAVVIFGNTSAFGVLEVDSHIERTFSPEEIAYLQAAANILGITRERQQAEKAIREYQAILEQSNQDLQQFATTASHDLQAPMRKIKMFTERLMGSLSGKISEADHDMLQRLGKSADSMQHLIRDLLDLSKITKGQEFSIVDLNNILNSVKATLHESIQEKQAVIRYEPLCTILGDQSQLERLFQNLIENAIKYQPPNHPPEVDIAHELIGNCCTISIRDNGIGFKPEQADKIFNPLERLHGQSKYDGTGIGLSICKRIVERHGGTIRAQSTPGHGATFIIELPVKQT